MLSFLFSSPLLLFSYSRCRIPITTFLPGTTTHPFMWFNKTTVSFLLSSSLFPSPPLQFMFRLLSSSCLTSSYLLISLMMYCRQKRSCTTKKRHFDISSVLVGWQKGKVLINPSPSQSPLSSPLLSSPHSPSHPLFPLVHSPSEFQYSLAATVHSQRADLLTSTPSACLPIPLNPPKFFFKGSYLFLLFLLFFFYTFFYSFIFIYLLTLM